MALLGRAFLCIWHGLKPEIRADFDAYHTAEHMPERLGIPGFLRGRRFMADDPAGQLCFTLYEASHAEIFRSPAYLARLNDPTPDTRRIQPYMTDFTRGACDTQLSLGEGMGGAIATLRLPGGIDAPALLAACHRLRALHGICGVHLGAAITHVTNGATQETTLRDNSTASFGAHVLLLEGLAPAGLAAALAQADALLGATPLATGIFRLAFETRA